jgi:mRNA interferase RelE/StbE
VSDYQIIVVRSAQKELEDLPISIKVRLESKINALAAEPRPVGCRKLKGEKNSWRIRVGDYRVIYTIDEQTRIIDT